MTCWWVLNGEKGKIQKLIGMSNCTLARLGKDEPVTLEVLVALGCRIEDVVEFVED